jgi:hypothetical protein
MEGRSRSAGNGVTAVAVTTRRPIFSVRQRTTFNSIQNWSVAIPQNFYVTARNNDSYVEIVQNGTLTKTASTPTWANVDTTFSTIQQCVDADGISGGRVLFSMDAISGSGTSRAAFIGEFEKALLSVDSDGSTVDTISIVATSFSGTSNLVSGFCWKEVR